jgi:hypothetical protein
MWYDYETAAPRLKILSKMNLILSNAPLFRNDATILNLKGKQI